jgi:hypothetical protein
MHYICLLHDHKPPRFQNCKKQMFVIYRAPVNGVSLQKPKGLIEGNSEGESSRTKPLGLHWLDAGKKRRIHKVTRKEQPVRQET